MMERTQEEHKLNIEDSKNTDEPKHETKGENKQQKRFSTSDLVRFAGLIVFFIVMGGTIALLWPYIHLIFEDGGLDILIEQIQSAGWLGVLIVEAMQFLQVIVAFIPGEAVQLAAGMIYGPWIGALLILIGCVASSAFIFVLVHKLGAPFVKDMVPKKYMEKFESFEKSGKFNTLIFVLFLIPGLPKDVFTYLTPLSDMKLVPFLLITNLARIPGIVISTYAASGLVGGDWKTSVLLFVGLAVVAVIALIIYNKMTAKESTVEKKKQK